MIHSMPIPNETASCNSTVRCRSWSRSSDTSALHGAAPRRRVSGTALLRGRTTSSRRRRAARASPSSRCASESRSRSCTAPRSARPTFSERAGARTALAPGDHHPSRCWGSGDAAALGARGGGRGPQRIHRLGRVGVARATRMLSRPLERPRVQLVRKEGRDVSS